MLARFALRGCSPFYLHGLDYIRASFVHKYPLSTALLSFYRKSWCRRSSSVAANRKDLISYKFVGDLGSFIRTYMTLLVGRAVQFQRRELAGSSSIGNSDCYWVSATFLAS